MPEEKFELPAACVFFDGKTLAFGEYYFTVFEKDEDDTLTGESLFLSHKGNDWQYLGDVPWRTVSMCVGPRPLNGLVAASEDGQIAFFDDTDLHIENLNGVLTDEFTIRQIKLISNDLYAVGYGGVILKREANGTWREIQLGRSAEASFLESIDGKDDGTLVAVGLNGEVWEAKERQWASIDVPTDANLHDVYCAAGGVTYACGAGGAFLAAEDGVWKIVDTEIDDGFWKVAEFDGNVVVSSMYGLFEYRNGELIVSGHMPAIRSKTYYNIDAGFGELLVVDERRAVAFDGGNLHQIHDDEL